LFLLVFHYFFSPSLFGSSTIQLITPVSHYSSLLPALPLFSFMSKTDGGRVHHTDNGHVRNWSGDVHNSWQPPQQLIMAISATASGDVHN
jgi:hypothetical protein